MKKISYILFAAAALSISACDMFELDNYDGPDAQISGKIIDAETGENIQIEVVNQSGGMDYSTWPPTYSEGKKLGGLVVVEQGEQWNPEEQFWYVKFNGEYANNLVFAADYSVASKFLPCYDIDEMITVNKGANTKDFKMLPFGRIKDLKFNYDASSKKIKATFTPEVTDPSRANMIARVVLCCNTSNFVGSYFNLCAQDPGASVASAPLMGMTITPGVPVTLEIDTTNPANNEEFKYERTHYLRVGILVQGTGYNTNGMFNFSPVYTTPNDFSYFQEYDWATAE